MERNLFELGVNKAVGNIYMGASYSLEILRKVQIDPGNHTTAGCGRIDKFRLYNSEGKGLINNSQEKAEKQEERT